MLYAICFITTILLTLGLYLRFVYMDRKNEKNGIYDQHDKSINMSFHLLSILILLAAAPSVQAQQKIGYLLTIADSTTTPRTEVYKLASITKADSIIDAAINAPFPTKEILEHTTRFELFTDNTEIYCEKKEITGLKRNGKLKLKKLK